MAGERCDVPTYEWIQHNLKVLINDNYWQTEIGWIISCNYKVNWIDFFLYNRFYIRTCSLGLLNLVQQ